MIAEIQERETHRFTRDGSQALEELLRETCAQVGREIRRLIPGRKLEGILLAGGYGRGEGGVLHTDRRDRPYNDLDFYVFLKGAHLLNARLFGSQLHHLGEELSRDAGVEIELKADSLARWRHLSVSMFSYDVFMGHKWLFGDDSLFAGCQHHKNAAAISSSEAARLMLNRCSGLLFAAEHLERDEFTPEAADFVARNIAKAQLSMGDAVLTISGDYHWSCVERHERLKCFDVYVPWLAELTSHHAAGVEFKLHPKRSSEPRAALRDLHAEVTNFALKVWLWLESHRLAVTFDSAIQYSRSSINKCPEHKPLRNALVNGRHGLFQKLHRYPRERLFHSLPVLLWERARLKDAGILPFIQKTLNTSASKFRDLVHAYQKLWRRFN
jgi:hypothetical protein